MGVLFANRVKTTLSAAATAGATSLALSSAANLPAIGGGDYCYLTLTNADQTAVEVVKATAIAGNSVTVTRAQEGTAAIAWAAGTPIELRLTTQSLLDALQDRLGAADTAAAALKLATPRNFNITGDMTWQVTFDGSANVTGAGTIAAKAVTNAKLADMAAAGLKGATAAGAVTDLSVASVKTLLSITNVENKSSATIRGEITSSNVTTALGFTPEVAGTCLKVGGDGGLEIGSYLDFHTPADGVDFKVRFLADSTGKLDITAAQGVYVNGILMPDTNTLSNYVPKASNIGNADLNNAVTSGFHRYDVPTNGPGTGFNYAPLIVARANDTIAQVAFSYNTGDIAWRAGNPTSTGGTGAWTAWDKMSNYAKLSGPIFTGTVTLDASVSQVLRGGAIIGRDTTGATEYGRLSFGVNGAYLRGSKINIQDVAGTTLATIAANGDATFTGATMWLNTNKALWQHDGTNAYFRSQTGDLHLGAGGSTKLSINGTNGAITATGPITVNVGAANTGLDLASNDAYANLRVTRNANASMPGMWFGYGGAAGTLTFCPGGTATGMSLDTNNKLTVNGDIAAIRSGSPTTGVIFLGNSGNTYVYYDSAYYRMPGANLIVAGGRVLKQSTGRLGGDMTISTAGPSGGTDGDIWLKV